MALVRACDVPAASLLRGYKDGIGFADCCVTEVPGDVSQSMFIEAFYTSALFKVERTLLRYLASRPATDADAHRLATGTAGTFSAWRVERQSASELLLADLTGRTRSWLMVDPVRGQPPTPASTLLYFGSAVVPRTGGGQGKAGMGWPFHALLGFHRLYSRLLLSSATRRLGSA
jgi:hypothetical protein